MKNLFKMLGVGVAFIMMSYTTSLNATENSIKMECETVTTSCGIVGIVCGETDIDRAFLAIDLDQWQCPD